MPTYQYTCTAPDCGTDFELVQSFTDPAASACPRCGGTVRKVFSAVGVVFKGSGFYRTDSRSGNGKGSGAAGSTEKPAPKNGSGGKDSAPAASGASPAAAKNGSSSTATSPSTAAASA